jgi:filamentous hemagglutinin
MPRWKKAIFYIGLVALIVALNFLAARNEGRQQREAPQGSSAKVEQKPRRDPGTTNSNKTTAAQPSVANETNEGQVIRDSATPKPLSGDETKATRAAPRTATDNDLVMRNMRIRDETGRVVYSGDVDLRPTLDRIERGKRLRFPNDGAVFENRERRLPTKSPGYYHEYVLPTPGDDGPGAQRIVAGDNGEVYYTPDHYRAFRRLR